MTFSNLFFHIRTKFRKILWKLYSAFGSDELSFKRNGITWTALLWDGYISWNLFVFGDWHFREIDTVIEWLNKRKKNFSKDNIIVNVGANIGTTAIRLSNKADCNILAIEPIPNYVKLLKKNIISNKLEKRIKYHVSAVYDTKGELQMVIPEINAGGAEITHVGSPTTFEGQFLCRNTVTVKGNTLSNILKKEKIDSDKIALVWADTQGCEGHVIRTGSKLWENGVPLVAEFWPRGLKVQGDLEVDQLIKKYFRSFSILSFHWSEPINIIEQPIEEFSNAIAEDGDVVDVLLIP